MSEIGIRSPTNRFQNHFFQWPRNLTTIQWSISSKQNMTYIIGQMCCKRQRGLLYHLKTTGTLLHKRLKIGFTFLPTLHIFCILLHCQASQTRISKWSSTKLCQTVKRWALTICRRKVGIVPLQKLLAQHFSICSVFQRLRDIMANVYWTKYAIDNWARSLESTMGPYTVPNFTNFGPHIA